MQTLAITIGDPSGIGPEITVKALQRLDEFPDARFIVVGSINALNAAAEQVKLPIPKADGRATYLAVEDDLVGNVAYRSVETAVKLIAEKQADALVTGPISKLNLEKAGYAYPGHTEILQELSRRYFDSPNARAEMLFVYKKFRLLLLTRHIALRDVPAALAEQGAVARPLKTLIGFLRHQQGVDEPRIAILGINPHAGEISGDEEKKFLLPVIHAVNGIGASRLEGPFAADAFFRRFDAENPPYDAVVSAYHDQGLIPFKMLAGYGAVNVTIGLPFLRTSVGHGTAEDIVGKNLAKEDGLIAAIRTASSAGMC